MKPLTDRGRSNILRTVLIAGSAALMLAAGSAAVLARTAPADRGGPLLAGLDTGHGSRSNLVPVPVERRGSVDVEIWSRPGTGAVLRPGSSVTLNFRTSRDAYVAVYDVDTQGRLRLLFPTAPWDDGYVEGGRTIQLPERGAGYRLMVTGPSGVERVVALASDRPLADRWRRLAEDDLAGLGRGAGGEIFYGSARGYDDDASYSGADPGDSYPVRLASDRRSVEPNLVPVPRTAPRLIPVHDRQGAVARDETWFRVRDRGWGRRW